MAVPYTYRVAHMDDLDALVRMETESYPADEAADRGKIAYRIAHAQDNFIVFLNSNNEIIGFINGTRSSERTLSHDSMSVHEPAGESVCIHSVVTRSDLRRRGLGTKFLMDYIKHTSTNVTPRPTRLLLISHQHLVPFYSAAGFVDKGVSPVSHGSDPWNEMEHVIPH